MYFLLSAIACLEDTPLDIGANFCISSIFHKPLYPKNYKNVHLYFFKNML